MANEILIAFEVDGNTGAQITRELTSAELAQRTLDATEASKQKTEADAKAATRASALAKLAALGLTADEIASL
jgi:hypothetical protein